MSLKRRIKKLERICKNKLDEIKVIKWEDGTIIWENKTYKNKLSNPYKSDLKP